MGRQLSIVALALAALALPLTVGAQPRTARRPPATRGASSGASRGRPPRARQHTVRAGDTWVRIARRNGIDPLDLALANGSRLERTLRPGQVLTIPPEGVVFVRTRQSLADVARAHECDPAALARLNRLRPGATLRVGQRLVLPGYAPSSEPVDRDWGAPSERGVARIRRRSELERVRLVDGEGRVTREGLTQVAALMRRQEEDQPALPHPRLIRLLAAISDHFGGREITLVSGRRPAGGRTRETSRHVSGHATDIRVEGVPARALWDYCRSLGQTGCGLYPRSTFVHVDVREHAAQWVDWSEPGRRSAYGNLRGPWRRACLRARRGPTPPACGREGRQVTRANEVPTTVELTPEALELMPVIPGVAPGDEPDEGDEEDAET